MPVSVKYFPGQEDESKEELDVGDETLRVTYGDSDFMKRDSSLLFRDGNRRIDFVLAYEEGNEAFKVMREEFENKLMAEGLELEWEGRDVSSDSKTCFVKIHAPWDILARYAEFTNLRMPFQVNDMWDELHSWSLPINNPLAIKHPLLPHAVDYFTAPFNREHLKQFHYKDKDTFFTTAQRSRLVWEILIRIKYGHSESQMKMEYKNRGINRLLAKKAYITAFPLHEGEYKVDGILTPGNDRALLYELWARPGRFYFFQPLHLIKKYFGAKIGIYFAWLGFYTQMLIPASIVGVICFIYGLITFSLSDISDDICDYKKLGHTLMCPLCNLNRCVFWRLNATCTYTKFTYLFDNGATVFFAIFMAFWATLFLEFWKRKQNEIIWQWDLQAFEESQEVIRPEFEAKVTARKRNPITQIMEPHLTFWNKMGRYWTSSSIVLFMLLVVLMSMVGVIAYRASVATVLYSYDDYLIRKTANISTSISAAVINLIIIVVLNKMYEKLADWLTEFERPRTQIEYEASFTFKMFLFEFLNFYSSLFYIAFFKGRFNGRPGKTPVGFLRRYTQDECEPAGCLIELCIQLATIMIGKQILNNIVEIIFPVFGNWLRNRKRKERLIEHNRSRIEKDFNLEPMPPSVLFNEYLEMVIQYGFVTMFVAAFPLAPLFAFLNNVVEIRLDAYKFLTQLRRPVALRADSIGAWYDILDVVSHLSVTTNAFMIAFTTDMIPSYTYKYYYSETGTFEGYLNNSLSYLDFSAFDEGTYDPVDLQRRINESFTFCRYRDYRQDEPPYKRNLQYWHVFGIKLAFIVIFEHLVLFTTGLLAYCITDIPAYLKQLIRREKQLQYDLLYNAEQEKIQRENIERELSVTPSHPKPLTRLIGTTSHSR